MTTTRTGRTTKDNSKKHPYVREQWMKAKREGRPKQVWVWDEPMYGDIRYGHWEKVEVTT